MLPARTRCSGHYTSPTSWNSPLHTGVGAVHTPKAVQCTTSGPTNANPSSQLKLQLDWCWNASADWTQLMLPCSGDFRAGHWTAKKQPQSNSMGPGVMPSTLETLGCCSSCVCVSVCLCACTQSCPTLCDPMDAPLSKEFSRQEYWSRMPFPMPRDLPNPGVEPVVSFSSSALAGRFFNHSTTWEASNSCYIFPKH